jgi:hypothetical protein
MILGLQGGGLEMRIDAARGGRITSIRGSNGREWLAPSSNTQPTAWGDPFVRKGMGGWDEIVPSTSATRLADGTSVPDHGDAWSVPWDVQRQADTSITAAVDLKSIPVRLTRVASATSSGIQLSYRASTSSAGSVPFAWSAHPQFIADSASVVSLRSGVQEIFPDLIREYPEPRIPIGPLNTALFGEMLAGTSVKAFVQPSSVVDSATLTHANGDALTIRWDAAALPFIGLFWDHQEFASGSVIAIEPSTAFGDNAGEAESSDRIARVSRTAALEWHLELQCTARPLV